MSTNVSERKEFVNLLQHECTKTLKHSNDTGIPGGFQSYAEYDRFIEGRACRLIQLGKTLHYYYEAACNRELSSFETTKVDRLECEVDFVCNELCLKYEIETDPRGSTVRLKLPSGRTNDFAGTGYCVP